MSHGKIGPGAYLVTLLALLVLAGISFGVSYLPLGPWETPVAMAIAVVKAALVLFIFMYLYEAKVANKIVMVVATAFVVLLISLLGLDIVTRFAPPALPPAL